MTTTITPPSVVNPPRRTVAWIVVGTVIIVIGFLTAISGGVLLALFGSGKALSTVEHPVSTSTSALIGDLGTITDTSGFEYVTGAPTLHVSADSAGRGAVFVGVGPAEEVQRYLAGVATDRVTDFEMSPFSIDVSRQPGSKVPGAPEEQKFWVASAQSTTGAELAWQIQDGHYQVVIMNADGSADVHTQARIGVSLPDSFGIWMVVLAAGVVFMVIGTAVVIGSSRRENTGR
ncbi:MAG TPA: hypothetical protein VFC16_17865 [Nakamurella sp.]|jgi:hypothetical protein|nr:hypothetical protein [Nakamurella sp.]